MKLLSIVRVLFEEVSRGNRSLIKEDVNYDDVVADLFKIEPELASIGSREQYIEYLKGIFPDSKLKDVVYNKGEEIVISSQRVHILGSKQDIDGFKKFFS